MTKPASLASVHYDFVHNIYESTVDGVSFKSDLESQLTSECKGRVEFGIMRYTKAQLTTDDPGYPIPESVTKHIGNYYYKFAYPQMNCSENDGGTEKKMDNAYKSMYDSLTAS